MPEESSNHSTRPQKFKTKRNWSKIFKKAAVALLAIVVLAGLGLGAYTLFGQRDSAEDQPTESASVESSEADPESLEVAQALSETYSSSALRLDFMYPSDWTVNEADRGISVTSPEFSYTTFDGEEVTGNFKIYIRKGARSVDGKYLGRGLAIKESEEITYLAPESGQREDTFLSSFGLDKPDNFAYFIVQGNFELEAGDTLGPDFAKEVDAYLIFGGYGANDISDDLGSNQLPVDSYEQTSQYKTGVEIVRSLKLR